MLLLLLLPLFIDGRTDGGTAVAVVKNKSSSVGGRAEQSRWFNSKEGRERPFDLTAVSLNLEKLWAVSPLFPLLFRFFFSFSFSFILQHFSNGHTTPTSPTTRLFPLLVCPPLRLCAYLFLPIELEQHRARFRHQINFFFSLFFFFFLLFRFTGVESPLCIYFAHPLLPFLYFLLSFSLCVQMFDNNLNWIWKWTAADGRPESNLPHSTTTKKIGEKRKKKS